MCPCVLQREIRTRQRTLFVQDLGSGPGGTLVGGVVECATEPRPRVVYIHVSSLLQESVLKQLAAVLTTGS